MAGGLRIAKRVPPAHLLKAPYVMEKAAKPGKVNVLLRKSGRGGHALGNLGHAVRVRNLERNAGIVWVVRLYVAGECLHGEGSIYMHLAPIHK